MKKLGLFITLITALITVALLAPGLSLAGEEHEVKYRIKVAAFGDDDEIVDVEFGDMEVGESRQFFTESGKEVVVTRTEKGHTLKVDGREIDLDTSGHLDEHYAVKVGVYKGDKCRKAEKGHGCEGASKIIIRKMGGEEDEIEATADAFMIGRYDGEHHLKHCGDRHGERVEVFVDHPSALDHLLESGVLDDLDPETRQKIIDTLKEIEPEDGHKVIRLKKKIVVDVEEDDEEN